MEESKPIDATTTNAKGIQKGKSKKRKDIPFESIFKDPDMVEPLIDFLEERGIIDTNGKWIGIKNGKTDIMGFIDALKLNSIINFTNDTEIGKIFKEKFNVGLEERSMTLPTNVRDDARNEYKSIIADFLLAYKQPK